MSEVLLNRDQQAVMQSLGNMRGIIKRLTSAAPTLLNLTMELRHEMIELTSRVQALNCDHAAQRMTGEAPALTQPARIDEMPLFAHGHVLTELDVQRMERLESSALLRSLHRAGDHTLDDEEEAA